MEPVHRFSHPAMNTLFEILINHPDVQYAAQAAHEAFLLLGHLEHNLSRFISNSDISRINYSPGRPVPIGEHTAECLRMARQLEKETLGYFNIAVGAVIDQVKAGRETRIDSNVKMDFELDTKHFLASVPEPVKLDLGGIAKGYAVDNMIALLRDWEIGSALVHGGQSTVFAYGNTGGNQGWPVSVHDPFGGQKSRIINLTHAMAASGLEKGFHIVDPGTGRPPSTNQAAWSFAPAATEADALSTAFMLMTDSDISRFCDSRTGYGALKMRIQDERILISAFGEYRW